MKVFLGSCACAVALVTLTSFAVVYGPTAPARAVVPAPIKLADLPVHRAFHATSPATFLGTGNGWGILGTFPSSEGVLITQVAVSAISNGSNLKIEVNGVVMESRIIGGSWGAYGALMPLTDSFKFDPPIVVAPGSTLKIHGDSDSTNFTLSIAGWTIQAGEL